MFPVYGVYVCTMLLLNMLPSGVPVAPRPDDQANAGKEAFPHVMID